MAKAGRPKRVFTPEQIAKMEEYAYDGCQTKTIAVLLDIPRETIDQRKDIQQILTKKRCERKLWLRKEQLKHVTKDNSPVMGIFLGKQPESMGGLGQTDRQDLKLGGDKDNPLEITVVLKQDGKKAAHRV